MNSDSAANTRLKLGADCGPSVLGAALQSVLLVSAQNVFKQIVDKVRSDEQKNRRKQNTHKQKAIVTVVKMFVIGIILYSYFNVL